MSQTIQTTPHFCHHATPYHSKPDIYMAISIDSSYKQILNILYQILCQNIIIPDSLCEISEQLEDLKTFEWLPHMFLCHSVSYHQNNIHLISSLASMERFHSKNKIR